MDFTSDYSPLDKMYGSLRRGKSKKVEEIILTFAIGTYNRAELLLKLVKSILSIELCNIEVAVTDNCSSDNTLEMLSEIRDKRLSVYSNETNIGPTNNWVRSVFNSKGKYVCYVNDKDTIDITQIPEVIALLTPKNYTYVLTGCNVDESYPKGYNALYSHYLFTHTTGMIFNGEFIRQRYRAEDFYKYEPYMSSLDYLARVCMCEGDTAKSTIPLWKAADMNYLADHKSHVNLIKNETSFHKHPEQLLFQYKGVTQQIFRELEFEANDVQRDVLHFHILMDYYHHLNEYKQYKLNREICSHYGLKYERVPVGQMLYYVQRFFNETIAYMQENQYSTGLITRWKRKRMLCYIYTIASGLKVELRSIGLT